MSIAPGYRTNFQTLKSAFENGDVALIECTDKATRKPVVAICSLHTTPERMVEITPFAKMFDGNPYEELLPPS